MLPRHQRLTRPEEFRAVMRSGGRSGGQHVIVHVARTTRPTSADPASSMDRTDDTALPSRAGLVVGRSVGSAVTRNRVSRRLRAHLGQRLEDLPPDLDIAVRALPSAAQASWSELTRDTDRCLDKAVAKLGQRARTPLSTVS